MSVWFLDDLARLKVEREAVKALERSSNWLKSTQWALEGSRLVVDATLQVEAEEFSVRLLYPEQFPAVPPAVRPKNPAERWSSHQYGDGTLCLEWGPDTWQPCVTGAQLLESAHKLLSLESPTGPRQGRAAPTRHQLTQGQWVRAESWRYLLNEGLAQVLSSIPEGTCAEADLTVHLRPASVLAIVHSITNNAGQKWINPAVPRPFALTEDGPPVRGALVVRLPDGAEQALRPKNVAELNALIALAGQPPLPLDRHMSAIIVDSKGFPHVFVSIPGSGNVYEYAPVWIDEPNAAARRVPESFTALMSSAVGIVGLGSLGSKIAEGLARVGVGRFHLTDDDLFLPGNVVRNALDLSAVGDHKVDAVAELIASVSPHARTRVSQLNLGGQESNAALSSELERLSQCDIIIDATANPQVFNLLAHTAQQQGVSLAWGEVLAGGLGGVVARSRPGRDPGPHEMRRALAEFTHRFPPIEGVAVGDYGLAGQGDGEPLIASDADVSAISSFLTAMVIDCLLGTEPSRYPGSLYLVGLSRGWIFDAPFHVWPIIVPMPPPTSQSSSGLTAHQTDEEVSFLNDLLDKAKA